MVAETEERHAAKVAELEKSLDNQKKNHGVEIKTLKASIAAEVAAVTSREKQVQQEKEQLENDLEQYKADAEKIAKLRLQAAVTEHETNVKALEQQMTDLTHKHSTELEELRCCKENESRALKDQETNNI